MGIPDSPSEHVASLQAQLRTAHASARRLEEERDQSRAVVDNLRSEIDAYRRTTAAINAGTAQTAHTALERLQKTTAIVDAAVEWRIRGEGQRHELHGASAKLAELVDVHLAEVRARS